MGLHRMLPLLAPTRALLVAVGGTMNAHQRQLRYLQRHVAARLAWSIRYRLYVHHLLMTRPIA